jgi:hypothetical protein
MSSESIVDGVVDRTGANISKTDGCAASARDLERTRLSWSGCWTGGPFVATLPCMSEDDSSAAPAASSGSETAPPAGFVAPEPINKLHEWAAAIAIMAFLTLVLVGFIFFLRGTSL